MKLIDVESVTIQHMPKKVYDIEVEEAHQYIANNYVVHNCTTSCNVGVHYPVATLIDEIVSNKCDWEAVHDGKTGTEIIVDGGLNNFDDIQKCLALGAFAVMNGSFFAKSEEACGEVRYLLNDEDSFEEGMKKEDYDKYHPLIFNMETIKKIPVYELDTVCQGKPYREYYGMSTKRAQSECGNVCSKTSEGIVKPVQVMYPIAKWADNMKSYLASAMSYTNCSTIEEFRQKTEVIVDLSGDKSFRK